MSAAEKNECQGPVNLQESIDLLHLNSKFNQNFLLPPFPPSLILYTAELRSSDPFSTPSINIGYFSDAGGEDLETMKKGIALAREMILAPSLAPYMKQELFPGVDVTSDDQMNDYLRTSVCSGNALVGTCAMGISAQQGAVVSSDDLKVFGVSHLRVVDASVIPTLPGAQSGAAVVMIAERAAHLIISASKVSRV